MRSVLVALSMTIAAALSAAAAAAPRDLLIVPGERVGPIALGMTAGELSGATGVPPETQQQGADTIYSWGDVVAQISDKSPGVDVITVNDSRYQTAGHVHVGLAALAVPVVLGQPQKVTDVQGLQTFDYDGLTVIVRNNLVVQIRVRK